MNDDVPKCVRPYSYPAIVHEYESAWQRIHTPAPPRDEGKSKLTSRQDATPRRMASHSQRILDAAVKLYQPGDSVSPVQIARETGLCRQTVSSVISRLRSQEQWPYTGKTYHKR